MSLMRLLMPSVVIGMQNVGSRSVTTHSLVFGARRKPSKAFKRSPQHQPLYPLVPPGQPAGPGARIPTTTPAGVKLTSCTVAPGMPRIRLHAVVTRTCAASRSVVLAGPNLTRHHRTGASVATAPSVLLKTPQLPPAPQRGAVATHTSPHSLRPETGLTDRAQHSGHSRTGNQPATTTQPRNSTAPRTHRNLRRGTHVRSLRYSGSHVRAPLCRLPLTRRLSDPSRRDHVLRLRRSPLPQ